MSQSEHVNSYVSLSFVHQRAITTNDQTNTLIICFPAIFSILKGRVVVGQQHVFQQTWSQICLASRGFNTISLNIVLQTQPHTWIFLRKVFVVEAQRALEGDGPLENLRRCRIRLLCSVANLQVQTSCNLCPQMLSNFLHMALMFSLFHSMYLQLLQLALIR